MEILRYLQGGKISNIIGLEQGSEEVYIKVLNKYGNQEIETTIKVYHEQDCCESVSLEEWHGNINIGDTFVSLERRTQELDNLKEYESATWTFIVIDTVQGTLTMRWLGESNGYYSESADIEIDFPEGIYQKEDGKYFAYYDGYINEVEHHKIINGITFAKIKGKNQECLVSNGVKSAHGYNFKSAMRDLNYKITQRDLSDYREMNVDELMTYEEAITCYRVVTGACASGTDYFLETHPEAKKDKMYNVKEIVRLTVGQYGHKTFKNFFNI